MIYLINNNGFKWLTNGNMMVKGYFEGFNSNYGELNNSIGSIESLIIKVKTAKGFFSLVYEDENFIFAAVDRIRSIPLFYALKNGIFYLSDDARWIREKVNDVKIDDIAFSEFYLTGYVTGKDTFFPNVKQIQAGEFIVYDKNAKKLRVEHYFKFKHKDYFKLPNEDLVEKLDEIHVNVFKRLIDSLDGRLAVIPLSGGYDSRLIAVMLRRLGYENVICFTYGKESNAESIISKMVAENLGYKWVFIPYTKEKWRSWFSSEDRKAYFEYSDGLSSLPHIQDIIAVSEMKERNIISNEAVFIPGHALDFVAGSHIPEFFIKKDSLSNNKIVDQILKVHYSLWNDRELFKKNKEVFSNRIFNIIEYRDRYTNYEIIDLYEQWIWSERQSKFIAHSVRVYDFLNMEWRLPFWEKEIVDFWSKVTVENRFNRKLYLDYVNYKQPQFNYLSKNKNYSLLKRRLMVLFPSLYRAFIKNKKRKKNDNHPLQWYGIINDFELDDKTLNNLENINSFLTYVYLKDSKFL